MLIQFYRAVIARESQKLLKQRDRLAAAMVRPVLWLWIIGGGMQALAGIDYTARLLPGIIGMTLLFGGMVGGLSIALDKDAGTMRLLVTAPVKTRHILIAKTLGAALGALVQMALLVALLLGLEGLYAVLTPLGVDLQQALPWVGRTVWPQLHVLLPAAVLAALSCAALGVLCGTFAKSIDGFAVMMNFVIFPVFFFSGALYPIDPMPALARWVSLLNPFSYCVDMLRHAFTSHAEFSLILSSTVLIVSTLAMLVVATWKFSQSGAAVPLNT
ncbi:ABC-2 type transport system permease protein [Limnobacter thiooxidans]|uniref:Transport permease protein n=1 Tax=Limnobacter thiooxidans TaxID=131080 RepID=A0AA86MCZ2_9BURK|nr:ABC-2 type transport system permease protein [Limnobacter thiooxidans]BET25421.1 ABC transporter permease [Limnobacter thiooxidans]